MKKLATLWKRPSYDGKSFTYYLLYTDEQGKRRQKSLGHADARKAERQRAQLERELRMGILEPGSMRLSDFLEDSLARTRGQVRESTLREARSAMCCLISAIGDIDHQRISHSDGEKFLQWCLDSGNAPATAAKKLRHIKRVFQLAVSRGQLEGNPFRYLKQPKVAKQEINTYSPDECYRLIKAAKDSLGCYTVRWELLILVALCTGLRRGETLNLTWRDVDFDLQVITVQPKENTRHTWEWHVKDAERRRLPLSEELVALLAEHQTLQPEGHPYVFVPPTRYARIQLRRQRREWSVEDGRCPVNNFTRQFKAILHRGGAQEGTFHDLRRTALSNWLSNGLGEFDVMNLAGHSCFETTRAFYLAVRNDLLQRARAITRQMLSANSVANLLQMPSETGNKKWLPHTSA